MQIGLLMRGLGLGFFSVFCMAWTNGWPPFLTWIAYGVGGGMGGGLEVVENGGRLRF